MIVLASKSRLRQKTLDKSELNYNAVGAEVDEREIEKNHARKTDVGISQIIALAKAEKIAKNYPNDIIVGADTLRFYLTERECQSRLTAKMLFGVLCSF
jgi:septum formation protein